MSLPATPPTRALIHLDRLTHNLRLLRELAGGVPLWPAVKANAYGHGAELVATHLQGQALALSREVEDRDLEAALLCDAGHTRLMNGDDVEARAHLLQAADVSRQISDRRSEGLARVGLALLEIRDGQPARGRESVSRIAAEAREIEAPRLAALALLARGEAQRVLDASDESLNDFREAVKIAGNLGDPDLLWQACHLGGHVATLRGDLEGGAKLYSRALAQIEAVARDLDESQREPYLADPRKWKFREEAIALAEKLKDAPP